MLLLNQNCKQLRKLTIPLMAEGTQINRQAGVSCMKIILTNCESFENNTQSQGRGRKWTQHPAREVHTS